MKSLHRAKDVKITFMLALFWHQVHSLNEHGTLKSRIYSPLIEVFSVFDFYDVFKNMCFNVTCILGAVLPKFRWSKAKETSVHIFSCNMRLTALVKFS